MIPLSRLLLGNRGHLGARALKYLGLSVLLVPGTVRVAAAEASPTPPKQETSAVNTPISPAKADGDPVQMQQVLVSEQKAGAERAFADKSASDTLAETISGAALKNPNAQSASDLLKNVSGVSVNQGADGSTSISMRGLDSRFVRVTVDGQRQGGGRNPLDSIPPEMIRSIEVSKALTPDQDADALGGAINVTTGTPSFQDTYVQGRHQVAVNSLDTRPSSRNSLTFGRPFALFATKPNAGLLLTASYDDQYRLREGLRDLREWPAMISPGPAPFTGLPIPVLTLPRVESTPEHRQRGGLVFNLSAQVGNSSISWRSSFSRDQAHRDRRVLDFDPSVGTPLVLAPDHAVLSGVPQNRRDQRQNTQRDAANLLLGGKTAVGRAEIEVSLGAVLTDEREPRTLESVFRSDHTFRTSYDLRADPWLPQFSFVDETNPSDTTSLSNPARYLFDSLSVTRTDTRDRDLVAKLDTKLNVGDGKDSSSFLKFGGKVQQRRRKADTDRTSYDSGTLRQEMGGLVGAAEVSLHDGGYRFGPIPDAEAVGALLTARPTVFQRNATETLVNSTTGDYEATETIAAGYGMGRFKFDRWTLLGGLRLEETKVRAAGRQIVLDAKGNVTGVTPAQTDRTYLEVLPGLHARFDPQSGWIVRSAVTRSLSRPNYSELAPTRQINFLDGRSRSGNPDLKPYAATNFDFSVDRYHERVGLVSVAVFFKKIDHFIADAQYPVTIGTLGQFIEFKRINGDSARVGGAEFGWQSVKWPLPAGLGSANVVTNYTFLHSDTRIPQRPGEVFSLSKQSTHQGNVTLSAERGRFSVDATLRYRSKSLEDVIDPGFDNYRMGAFDAELGVVYKITKDTRLTLGVSNLFNVPMREYAGLRSRVNAYERSGVDINFGFQWKVPQRVGNVAGK